MYGFEGLGLSEVQLSISEPSVVDLAGGGWTRQTHFMVGPGRGPTTTANRTRRILKMRLINDFKRKLQEPMPSTQGSHNEVTTPLMMKELSYRSQESVFRFAIIYGM